jgi:hypothetical protein
MRVFIWRIAHLIPAAADELSARNRCALAWAQHLRAVGVSLGMDQKIARDLIKEPFHPVGVAKRCP